MSELEIIDIATRIKRKRAADCGHLNVEVDDNSASLSCGNCGAELDPWWFLRRMAHDEERENAHWHAEHARITEWCAQANATMTRLQREISELTAAKNRLWNERVNDAPLGTQLRKRRGRALVRKGTSR